MEKRRETRKPKRLLVRIGTGSIPVMGSTLNVSIHGMEISLRSKRMFKPGQEMLISLETKEHEYRMQGLVRWFKTGLPSYTMGMQLMHTYLAYTEEVCHDNPTYTTDPSGFKCQFDNVFSLAMEYEKNIRFGGLYCPSKHLPPLDTVINVEVFLPDQRKSLPVRGRVVNHQPDGFGIFIDNLTDVRSGIEPFLKSIMERDPSSIKRIVC